MTEGKLSIKKIIGGLLIILLSMISGLFSVLAILAEGMSPFHDIPLFWFVILFASPLIFISGILLLGKVKWAWRLFLITLTIGIIFVIIFTSLNLQHSAI